MPLVQGQNTLERIWPRLCELQTTNPALFTDANFRASLGPQIYDYQLSLPAAYTHDMQLTVSWSDERIQTTGSCQVRKSNYFKRQLP